MRYSAFAFIALLGLMLVSCEKEDRGRIRPWNELPIAYEFSDKVADDVNLSDEEAVRVIFKAEMEHAGMQEQQRPFFMRGTFWAEANRVHYTWLCRVPESGELDVMLESEVQAP